MPEDCDFIYIDDLDIIFNRVSDQNSFVAQPNTKSTVLCCSEITFSPNDDMDLLPKKKLHERVLRDLSSINLINQRDIIDTFSIKLPEVYPMFHKGYRELKSRMDIALNQFSNFYSLGSLAEFAYSDLQILFAKSKDIVEELTSKTSQMNNIGRSRVIVRGRETLTFLGKTVGGDNPCFIIGGCQS